jgi:hypothetical protein
LYSAVASRNGVASVIPSAAVAKSASACCTRAMVAAGTRVVVVVDAGVVELVGTLDAVAFASASAAWASASSD